MCTIENKRNIFICGAKCIGHYGGYETFIDRLTEQHEKNDQIQYHIITKANGEGRMDEQELLDYTLIDDHTFLYHGAEVVKLHIPQIGSAQAVLFDVKAFLFCLKYCETHMINKPIFYVLACRIGPFFGGLVNRAHKLGGVVYVNPDGHEWKRSKWSKVTRSYWKISEKLMVKHADMLICDSKEIEKYIQEQYKVFQPKTMYIAYGADTEPSSLVDNDPRFKKWLNENKVRPGQYYMCCGRFVPENSFEIMIREFMKSHSNRKFIIITRQNNKLLDQIEKKLHFKSDQRIVFSGTVYDSELLKKIREKAYANFHGHTVGGTNPSLLEALASTRVNLLIDVGFNREVAEDSAMYWNTKDGSLANLIDKVEKMTEEDRTLLGERAKKRIITAYSWKFIADRYEKLWIR